MSAAAAAAATAPSASPPPQSASSGPPLWSHGSFGFKDLLDIINPLQHLPIIGSIYRYLTGDEPSGGARIVGDTIYGGPIGFGVGVVETMLTDSHGRDLGERTLAAVFGPRDDGAAPGAPVVAAAAPGSAAPQATLASAIVAPGKPVDMAQLFHSPSAPQSPQTEGSPAAAAPAPTPEQSFHAQSAQFEREISRGRGSNGAVLNNRPVPLELSSGLLPAVPPAALRPVTAPAKPAAAQPAPTAANSAALNPIAQKMLDALAKYEKLKKQQEQQDSATQGGAPMVDLAL